MTCQAQFAGHNADQDLREIMKLQSAARHHHRWLSQNRTKDHIKDWEAVAWTPTLRIMHNNNSPLRLFTSVADCRMRSHRIKKLHGMLPTLKEMKKRLPEVYTTDICQRCLTDVETDHHLWNCPQTWDAQQDAWGRAIQEISETGNKALRHATKAWIKDKGIALTKGRAFTRGRPQFTPRDVETE